MGNQKKLPVKQYSDYRILREISAGSYGKTYLAEYQRKQEVLKIARYRKKTGSTPDIEMTFNTIREIIFFRNLSHPNIAKIQSIVLMNTGLPNFSLQSLEGDLYELQGTFDQNDIRDFLRQILSALVYLHGKGVLHNDIKPHNILRKGRHYYLTDFGILWG